MGSSMPRLHYVLRGIKKDESERGVHRRERLPITPSLLRLIRDSWASSGGSWDTKLLWVACCLAFFGFLRAGEFTAPSIRKFDPTVDLCVSDLAIDNSLRPTMVQVVLKQSKTDPFRKGVQLLIGKSGTDICPVAALLDFLRLRGSDPGFLFRFRDGTYLTRQRLVEAVRAALEAAGVDHSKYCGHSFRIGAATVAAEKGVEDSVVKILGRWDSLAYLEYIRIPRANLVGYSRVLVS